MILKIPFGLAVLACFLVMNVAIEAGHKRHKAPKHKRYASCNVRSDDHEKQDEFVMEAGQFSGKNRPNEHVVCGDIGMVPDLARMYRNKLSNKFVRRSVSKRPKCIKPHCENGVFENIRFDDSSKLTGRSNVEAIWTYSGFIYTSPYKDIRVMRRLLRGNRRSHNQRKLGSRNVLLAHGKVLMLRNDNMNFSMIGSFFFSQNPDNETTIMCFPIRNGRSRYPMVFNISKKASMYARFGNNFSDIDALVIVGFDKSGKTERFGVYNMLVCKGNRKIPDIPSISLDTQMAASHHLIDKVHMNELKKKLYMPYISGKSYADGSKAAGSTSRNDTYNGNKELELTESTDDEDRNELDKNTHTEDFPSHGNEGQKNGSEYVRNVGKNMREVFRKVPSHRGLKVYNHDERFVRKYLNGMKEKKQRKMKEDMRNASIIRQKQMGVIEDSMYNRYKDLVAMDGQIL